MVGCPASGKSTVSHDFFHEKKGYVLVNQDTLGTASKCAKVGREEGGGGGEKVDGHSRRPCEQSRMLLNTPFPTLVSPRPCKMPLPRSKASSLTTPTRPRPSVPSGSKWPRQPRYGVKAAC